MFLVDTSVWIEVFRRPSRFELGSVADLDEVATCLPIIQEVLQGFSEEHAFRIAREAMFAFPILEAPLTREVFEEATHFIEQPGDLRLRSGQASTA
jgi:predicted nucleic acid-binding protein